MELPLFSNDSIKFPLSGKGTIFVDEGCQQEFEINYQNEPMMRARKLVEQLITEKNRDKYMRGDKSQAIRPEKIVFPGGNPESVNYEVEMNPPNPFI